MAEKSKAEDFIFAAGVLIVSWVMLFADAPFRLDFKEQISIFLFDADRISWYLSNPAVVSSVIGDWLTQFYTNRVMAPTLSVILFAAIIIGLKDFFRKAETGMYFGRSCSYPRVPAPPRVSIITDGSFVGCDGRTSLLSGKIMEALSAACPPGK